MNIENFVVGMCAIGYMVVGVCFLLKGNYPWSFIWLAYSMGNFGLMWAQSSS